MPNNKKITVVKGQEYKICRIDLKDKNNLLYDLYIKANKCLEEIENYGNYIANHSSDSENNGKYNFRDHSNINNIIAFCGDRGQGKTSAMMSYASILSEDNSNKYYIMNPIDPTALEKDDNILMMILSAIFKEFKEKRSSSEFGNKSFDKILEFFQKTHHHINSIKNSPNSANSVDFDETIENLSKFGDSMNLRSSFEELITEFLKVIGKNNGYFIIPIDDTDLNISRAFEIVEDIRKYLLIPNIIVIMATKFDQLSLAVEQHYLKSYETMIKAGRISNSLISQMTAKYLDKLIPDTRRINIPNITAVDENGNLPAVIYKENSKGNETDILQVYGEDIQTQILKLIEAKTAIAFETKNLNQIHWIIPCTMRELVNLLALLGHMETTVNNLESSSYIIDNPDVYGTNMPVIRNLYNNLQEFYNYFRTYWIVNNLSEEERAGIEKIIDADTHFMHTQTLIELKKRVSELDESLRHSCPDKMTNTSYPNEDETLVDRINNILKDQSASNKYGYSLGDILDALMTIEKCARLDSILKFTFAVRTVYTIKMMLMAENELVNFSGFESYNEAWKKSAIIKFIGIDFIGKYNTNSLFPTIGSSRKQRGRFNIPIQSFTEELEKISPNYFDITNNMVKETINIVEKNYLKQLIFWGYNDSDYDYLQERSANNRTFSNLYFNISYFFISTIQDTAMNGSNAIFMLSNIEKIFNIISEQLQNKDKRKEHATLQNLYLGFFERFKDFTFSEAIISSLDKDKIFIAALDNALKNEAESEKKQNKNKRNEPVPIPQ